MGGKQSVLRIRDFRLIFVSVGLSALGDELALIALAIRVHDIYQSHGHHTEAGLAVAAVLLAGLLPLVLFSPIAGLIVDRVENVRLLGLTSLAQAGLAVALAFTHALAPILVLSFLLGTGASLGTPALFALTPVATGEDRVGDANALLETARYAGAVLGPILSGGIAAGLGSRFALLADAATFLVIAGGAAALRIRRRPERTRAERRRGEARKGFSFLAEDKLLRLLVAVVAAFVLFACVDSVAEVFFAKDVLDAGNAGYGGLATAWMIGMVVGATMIARRLPAPRLGPAVLLATIAGGAGIGVAAAFPSLALTLVAFFVGGVGNGVLNVAIRTLAHRRVPEELRGRVFAAYYGLVISTQIGATAAAGGLVAQLGSRGTLLLGGFGGAVVGVIGLLWYAALPASEREVAEPPLPSAVAADA